MPAAPPDLDRGVTAALTGPAPRRVPACGRRRAPRTGRPVVAEGARVPPPPADRTFALALIGDGIGGSLTPAMHEEEGRAQGLSVTYRPVDLARLRLRGAPAPPAARRG